MLANTTYIKLTVFKSAKGIKLNQSCFMQNTSNLGMTEMTNRKFGIPGIFGHDIDRIALGGMGSVQTVLYSVQYVNLY